MFDGCRKDIYRFDNNIFILLQKFHRNAFVENTSPVRLKVEQDAEYNDTIPSVPKHKSDDLIAQLTKPKAAHNQTFYLLQKTKEKLSIAERERDSLSTQFKETVLHLQSTKAEFKRLQAQIKQLQRGIDLNSSQLIQKTKSDVTESGFYGVEQIIDHKIQKKAGNLIRQFLIKWANFDASHNFWVAEQDLNCPSILEQYLKSNKM